MLTKYTYLLIDFFTILVPFIASFDKRINFVGQWRYYFPANIVVALCFLLWDYYFTLHGVWGFNYQYLTGSKIFNLPIEEVLFFITVPYSCTFIYESLKYFRKQPIAYPHTKYAMYGLGILLLAASPFFSHLSYTFSVLLTGGLTLLLLPALLATPLLNLFAIAYSISLIPMLIVNGLLTSLPVVVYNNTENISVRLSSIPVEDFLYALVLLGMNIGLYEWLSRKSSNK